MTQRRSAFTLAELMVVITIIAVLAGLVMVGYSVVGGSGKRSSTKATLETARALLNAVQSAPNGLERIKAIYIDVGYLTALPAPGNVMLDAQSATGPIEPPRYTDEAIKRTQRIMGLLRGDATNKAILEKLPAGSLMETPTNPGLLAKAQASLTMANDRISPEILLDSWGNPIIFVPKGGLLVTLSGMGQRIVTSSGVIDPNNPPPAQVQFMWRPFFASAGADGDFSKGDDNIYSFEN